MKKVERYQCELCSAVYDSEDEAKKCEKKHPKEIAIERFIFDEFRAEPIGVVLRWAKTSASSEQVAMYELKQYIRDPKEKK
jgi:hypothetical protein